MINTKTQNHSFLRLFYELQDAGFSYEDAGHILTLKNESLLELNVNDPLNYSNHLEDIDRECKTNIWFFFREIARLPIIGQDDEYDLALPFHINKLTFKMIWAFNNGIPFIAAGDSDTNQRETMELLLLYMIYVSLNDPNDFFRVLSFSLHSDTLNILKMNRLRDIHLSLLPKLHSMNYQNQYNTDLTLFLTRISDYSRITHTSEHVDYYNEPPILFGFNMEDCPNVFDVYKAFKVSDNLEQIYLSVDSSKIVCNDLETMIFHIMPEIKLNDINFHYNYTDKMIYTIKDEMSDVTEWDRYKFEIKYKEIFGKQCPY